ncbi:MAG: hypothetical protein U0527_01350 [Candidatus Eisenbacteria bacterium]
MYDLINAALLSLALAASDSTATQATSLAGTWHGTSTCVDKVHFPACKDEEVFYEARLTHSAPDTVSIKADRVVKGERLFMGELFFTAQPDSSWMADVHTSRVHFQLTLRRAGDRLTGVMIDLPSARRIRDIALERVR